MASIGVKIKNLPKKKKAYLFSIISFFAFVLILGIRAVYAYYNDTASISILANLIGDFDSSNGDVNLVIYKENDQGLYTRTYAVPAIGYTFDDSLTSCNISCSNNNSSDDCYYVYDSSNKTFSLTSNQKVTCKFYFKQEATSDINVYILKEDLAGTYTYNSKSYALVENVPAYGYKYIDYYDCDGSATVTYNSETKKFNVSTSTKDSCYVYFDSVGNADIITNVFVQSGAGSAVYNQVDSIPANNIYILSTNKTSYCYDSNGNDTNATISYTDGYINISAAGQQTCDIYLDLSS